MKFTSFLCSYHALYYVRSIRSEECAKIVILSLNTR